LDVDDKGNYWMSTFGGDGIYRFKKPFYSFDPVEVPFLSNETFDESYLFFDLLVDSDNNVWTIDKTRNILLNTALRQ